MNLADIISAVLLIAGSSFCLVAGIGLQRFDTVFARMHAATKSITLGLLLVAVGAAFHLEDAGDQAKLLLVAVLQFVTAPVAAHLVGRAAYRSGTEFSADMKVDELAGVDLDDEGTAGPAGP